MDWIVNNWLALTGIALASVALAKAITKVTPTVKDDEIVAKIEEVLQRLIGSRS